jgi:hypothetical protein
VTADPSLNRADTLATEERFTLTAEVLNAPSTVMALDESEVPVLPGSWASGVA